MKKKIILMLLCSLCIVTTGCSSESKDTASGAEETVEENKEEIPEEVDFTEIIVVDNDECVIKITSIKPDGMWGYTLSAYLENKSADTTYMYAVESASINGVKSDPLFATEVAPGKKSNSDISFIGDTQLEELGIEDFTDIELNFRVYDTNDWLADEVAKETINIYPFGEDKATTFTREPLETDTVLIDNENVTVTVTGYEDDPIWGYTAKLFLENKTDKNVMFSVEEASINGYMADPFWATEVAPGKCALTSMSWADTIFEDNGITDVEEIELKFSVSDFDDIMADDMVNEVIKLTP